MCRLVTRLLAAISLLAVMPAVSVAQDTPAITAENLERLASVRTIDFDALPQEAGEILNGRVYINADGMRLAVVNQEGQVVILADDGELIDVSAPILTDDGFPATFIDGAFASEGDLFASIHSAGDRYFVSFMTLGGAVRVIDVESANKPVTIWLADDVAWLEVVPSSPDEWPYLAQVPKDMADPVVREEVLTRSPLALAEDVDVVARIGRLAPPLAITVTADAQVKRWDLTTGLLTASAQVDLPPIYGYATPDGRWLLWRDPASTALHLLDFATGADRTVAPLNGTYIPFLFVTPGADVAIGVFPDDVAAVTAWDVTSGEQYALGLFRQCQRPPDMVRLSVDGSTLAIGCDAGLDIWRVVP